MRFFFPPLSSHLVEEPNGASLARVKLVLASPVGFGQHLLSPGKVANDIQGTVIDKHLSDCIINAELKPH